MTKKITFIGAGNMASSLIHGLVANGYNAKSIWATNPSPEKLQLLQQQCGINATQDNLDGAQHADVLVFAVKPQKMADVAQPLQEIVQTNKPLVISVAAGTTTTNINQWLGECAVVRAMPNTAALIGCGATGLFANTCTDEKQKSIAESILRSVGVTQWIDDEASMDTVTAVSGSGPAYFFLMMEAIQDAGEELGLTAKQARLLTIQTALGASKMALESKKSLKELRERVSSPGGTTEAALKVLESGTFRELMHKAIRAARQRGEELAKHEHK